MLEIETVSVEKTRYTRFRLLIGTNGFRSKVHKEKEFLNTTPARRIPLTTPEEHETSLFWCREVISQFNRVRCPKNRNIRTFTAAVAMREVRKGITVEEVLWELQNGICMYECDGFSSREIEKTITSALKPKYHGFRFPKEYLEAGGYIV
jgi:hypothetical protein